MNEDSDNIENNEKVENDVNFQSGEDLLKAKQEERKIRKNKKQNSLIRKLLKFVTFILVILFIYFSLHLHGMYLPQNAFSDYSSNRVLIVNNKIVKNIIIQNAIKDISVPKVPLFLSGLSKLKKEILLLSPVENVYIRRYIFPSKIMIIVKEAEPMLSISPELKTPPIAVFTKKGKLIKGKDYLPLPPECKTTLILSYENNEDDYNKWDVTKLNEFNKLIKYVETFTGEKIEYIDLRYNKDFFVKIKSANIRFSKNDERMYDKIKLMPSVLPYVRQHSKNIKYIDLRWDNIFLKL